MQDFRHERKAGAAVAGVNDAVPAMRERLVPPLLALGFALVASGGSTGDWGLEAPGQVTICAVDQASCDKALGLMRDGKLFRELPREGWSCRPHPGCRPESDLYIKGFNAP